MDCIDDLYEQEKNNSCVENIVFNVLSRFKGYEIPGIRKHLEYLFTEAILNQFKVEYDRTALFNWFAFVEGWGEDFL